MATATSRLIDEIGSAAATASSKLTVIEFGTGEIAQSLLTADHPNIEEVVVVCKGKSSATSSGDSPTRPLPPGASFWGNSCKTPSQMFSLGRALLKAGRTHIAIAFTASAGAAPAT